MNLVDKKVLLITSTNLACNPRCLKEARLLNSMGAEVTVVSFHLHNWTDEKEEQLNKELSNVNFYYLESTRADFIPWLIASLMEKLCNALKNIFSSNIFLQSIAISKRSWQLTQKLRKWNKKFDLIIAHNPPAFYPANYFAKKINAPFAIDVEDYHPGEGNGSQKRSVEILMNNVLPAATYISYASPLIKKYTDNLLNNKLQSKGFVINNTFSLLEFVSPSTSLQPEKLSLVWFSQFIDYGRGLEKILPVLDLYADKITLTLIGSKRESFFQLEIQNRKYIHCLPSLSQVELNKELSKYDVGLALEDKEADLNRNLCLTNKIWAYFQAGLFILASDTDAQTDLLSSHPNHGKLMSFEQKEMADTIKTTIIQKDTIRSKKEERFETAKQECWENDSMALKTEWQKII